MRKLKIAFLSVGRFTHIESYVRFFADRGHDVCWIAYDDVARELGVPTYSISHGADATRAQSKWRYLLSGLSARKLLRRLAPDIVHGHYVTSAGVISLLAGYRPFVLTAHGSDVIASVSSRPWRFILRRVFRAAACVNVVSEQLAGLVRDLGVPGEKILVAPVGVDTKAFAFAERASRTGPVRLLCTRTLDTVYDPITIVRACEILRRRGIALTLTFAARGAIEADVQAAVRAAGMDDVVRFHGGYRNAELPAMLCDHDFFVSASLWDGTSICLLEAMASGIFPIVTRITSNLAWLHDGVSALMFDPGNADALAGCVQRAVQEPAMVAAALRRNRETVEERADRARNMTRIEEAYQRIVHG